MIEIKRVAYYKVEKIMNIFRIPILVGLRRTGKTTILNQIADKYKDSEIIRFDSILLMSFNDLELYNYLNNKIHSGIKVLLLDEVQTRKNWDLIVKNLFDDHVVKKNLKVVVAGSSSLSFENKDTGVDRTQKVLISTLDFNEYLSLTSKERNYENFEKYLGQGAFPGYANQDISFEDLMIQTLEPILNDDIPSQYNINTNALIRLLLEISTLTNGEFVKLKSSKNTGLPITQIDTYLDILEKTQIIKRVYMCNEDATFPRYPKFKIYINPHFHLWLLKKNFLQLENKIKAHIIEAYWLFSATQINGYYKRFYYLKSKNGEEIDFVSLGSLDNRFKTLHEFKYSESVNINKIFHLLKADNKVIWHKGNAKKENGIKFESIINYKIS